MKFYSIRVAFVLQVVWMIMMSSCEKNQNVYSQPTDIPDNPSSVDVLSDKYASREITLELKENVPNSDGCIYFSFTSGKISGKSTSDAAGGAAGICGTAGRLCAGAGEWSAAGWLCTAAGSTTGRLCTTGRTERSAAGQCGSSGRILDL